MKMNRFLALVLCLCMLFTMNSAVFAVNSDHTEDLMFSEIKDSNINLYKLQQTANDLKIEQSLVDENGMIRVFIVMEGASVLDTNPKAMMDKNTIAQMQHLKLAQELIVSGIENNVLDGQQIQVSDSYTWLFNGVAATVPYASIREIAAMDGVSKVIIDPVYDLYQANGTQAGASLFTNSDGVMVGREDTWDVGYTGQGMKIAIIDTGLDVDHQNFGALPEDVLTETSATRDYVAQRLESLNANGLDRYNGLTVDDVYYNTKVVFGFNYADNNFDITHDNDVNGDHGTHVAGIAAANKVEGSEVVGVAPDAQLFIMKVYGSHHGGYGSDIIAALEDALKLGVDVVNMSLGTNAGFTSSADEFVNSIYASVAETNTVLSVSAGNSYSAGKGNSWGTDQNLASNPDNAVISEPSIYQNVLSIASVENVKIMRNYIQVSDGYQMGYVDTNDSYGIPNIMTLTGKYTLVNVGLGTVEEFQAVNVTGKIALVQRGSISFIEKCQNAYAAGATAIIVYNNAEGEFGMDLTDCVSEIPGISITMADGEYLLAAMEANPAVTVSFPTELTAMYNTEGYAMSDFSSWGVTPDLRLEPDITAPGGNIYSTITDGQYGLMSGTSMAAPNVSGITALVMQYAKDHFELDDYRTFVQNLLMSTSSPLHYGEEGLYYSPRHQGSGLANAYSSITTTAYLTVAGSDTPKVSLGDDADKTGVYEFTFTVTNFGDGTVYYELNTVVQTEDVATYEQFEGQYFMAGTPTGLGALTSETSNGIILVHDVDNSGAASSRDAYEVYLAILDNSNIENWENEGFRYDVNGDEIHDDNDVQAYLDALVGNDSAADLEKTALQVNAGESVDVDVSITLTEEDKEFFETYYVNGGYVEGYSFLHSCNGGVDLSLPYLAFFGSWDSAPIIDDGDYWDMLAAEEGEVVGNQYINVLWTNFYGEASYYYPGANVYVEEPFDLSHISVSPNGDGYFDTIDDIYTSLLRNVGALTYRYTNMDTGEVYYEQTAEQISKSVYNFNYGQIIPNVYSWFSDELFMWDWKDKEGNDLPNNTRLLLEIEATGAYEGATPDVWSVPVKIDLEAPELLDVQKHENLETGEVSLELTFRDNLAISVVALTSSNGQVIYAMEGVEDVEPDENGYQNHTMTFDITDATGKLMIVLGDYAMNERQYGLNLGGAGAPYGDLVAYQYNISTETSGWVSFSEGVEFDEVCINTDEMKFVSAEYVGGYVFAQTETGDLYGFKYEDMLVDDFNIASSYIARLENVYQDLAYSYVEGKLYGMRVDEYEGYPTTEIYTINLHGEYYDEEMWTSVMPYQEDWYLGRGGLYGLSMTINNEGRMYVLGLNYQNSTADLTETAYLWTAGIEYDKWTDTDRLASSMSQIGNTGITMDFLQSMTWDHNTGKLYWARFDGDFLGTVSELYVIDPSGKLVDGLIPTEKVGDLTGETCALFAPLKEETIASNEIYGNIPVMDPEIVARPVLRDDSLTMNIGGLRGLIYDLDPWYSNHTDVVWSSDNPSVVEVNQYGIISAVSTGTATITVANAADETKFDTVKVEVTALDLVIEGVVSNMGSGVGNVGGACTYKFEMVDGVASMETLLPITAPDDLNYGLSLATSVMGRGYIWACEYGNSGMVYQIDPDTGVVVDVLQPIDGDMLFGISYSESQDTFAAIMNMYLFVDLEFTHEETEKMLDSYSEETQSFNYHRLNLLDCLIAANDGFVTHETGQGASSEIVFCGITTIEDSFTYEDTGRDFLGNYVYNGSVNYTSTQTLVVLDNVGRLWYIDEIVGMTKSTDKYGDPIYTHENGSSIQAAGGLRNGMFEVEILDEEGNATYNIFNIRKIDETPLTDMYRDGTMPRITYHFSDIEFVGYDAEGAPMFAMSLYDYWNNGTTNELYLYVSGVGTGEWVMDQETWISYEVMTEGKFYYLGDTGEYNVIASIHSAVVTGGVDPEVSPAALQASYYNP